MSIIDIARECGADVVQRFHEDGGITSTFSESALTAFADRIRADERERASLRIAVAVDHLRFMAEGRGLIPGAADGYKMALAVIEPMFRDYLDQSAPVGEKG